MNRSLPNLLYLTKSKQDTYKYTLIAWTGRIIRDDKRGAIDAGLPPILKRLSLDDEQWKILTTKFEQ